LIAIRDWPDFLGDIPEQSEKRISDYGDEEQNAALEETGASQAPAFEVQHEEQSESIRETRRSSVSKSQLTLEAKLTAISRRWRNGVVASAYRHLIE
jgi:hypothetical protein